ncbi:MAG: cell division protein ZapA [Alphaproteobacteria bacterium]|nr:cell division protein ZapA [Alphaproteobacteria bacterium]MDD9919196.1 cell division protein ZapA [Alphaproteobacteria bacterium]
MNQQISLLIGGKTYRLAVGDGQETRLKHVAQRVDQLIADLKNKAPDMDRDHMVVLAAIQLADDLLTTEQARETEQKNISAFNKSLAERLEKLLPTRL